MSRRLNIANTVVACFTTVSLATISGLGCGSDTTMPSNPTCTAITGYTAQSTTLLSFATDVYPILADTSAANGGCAQALICHGEPAQALDKAGTKYLRFLFSGQQDAAMAKAELLMPSVNAPSMPRVTPGKVGESFLAYKIAKDRNGLACANSMCASGASVGTNQPCGDLMPTLGTLSDANRTKIMDWIAQGASN